MNITWHQKIELEKIIESNCKEFPYEGTEIDKENMLNSIIRWIENNCSIKDKED